MEEKVKYKRGLRRETKIIEDFSKNTCQNHIPKSAKMMPVWIRYDSISSKNDLVYLTDDEKYFVSIDHKRVYPVKGTIIWTMVDVPL